MATLHQLFRRLDVDAFEAALSEWAQGELGGSDEAIAIDGKRLRGIHDELLPGVHLVAAYAQGAGLVLAQKGGETPKQGDGACSSPSLAGPAASAKPPGILGFATPSDFVRAYPVSREWLALLIRRMDAVAAVYRLASSLSPGTGSLRSHVEFHRRGRFDATITPHDGRRFGVVRRAWLCGAGRSTTG